MLCCCYCRILSLPDKGHKLIPNIARRQRRWWQGDSFICICGSEVECYGKASVKLITLWSISGVPACLRVPPSPTQIPSSSSPQSPLPPMRKRDRIKSHEMPSCCVQFAEMLSPERLSHGRERGEWVKVESWAQIFRGKSCRNVGGFLMWIHVVPPYLTRPCIIATNVGSYKSYSLSECCLSRSKVITWHFIHSFQVSQKQKSSWNLHPSIENHPMYCKEKPKSWMAQKWQTTTICSGTNLQATNSHLVTISLSFSPSERQSIKEGMPPPLRSNRS